MSDTDKDKPAWLRDLDHGRIDHDHRDGECRIETLQVARAARYTQSRWVHALTCAKYEWDVWVCEKQTREPGCWQTEQVREWVDGIYIVVWWRATRCRGHRLRTFYPERSCSCDELPEAPTCTAERVYRTYGGRQTAPRDYRRDLWFGPERARERDDLRGAAREYNAYGEVDDFDFPNPQARHQASWWWSW